MPTKRRSTSIGLGATLCTIDRPAEPAEPFPELLNDLRYIGSYDWSPDATESNPSIIVPGEQGNLSTCIYYHQTSLVIKCTAGFPNVWSEPELPLQIAPDQGLHVVDNNVYILKDQPFLPLLTAVHEQQILPREDWKEVDFITDRNGLRKLLRWIGKASGGDFRLDTQLIGGKTVVMNRWDPAGTEYSHGDMYTLGFGKAVTKPLPPSTERSGWHHRVVNYVRRLVGSSL
jgi:hypothetical protein